jgi:hypothetical protein
MTNQKIPNKTSKYICELCNYETNNKKDYSKHILTRKHLNKTNTNKNSQKIPKAYKCHCGKEYKHASSLSIHKKICNIENKNIENKNQVNNNEEVNYKTMFVKIMKQNQELRKTVLEQQQQYTETINNIIPKIGNNNTTTNNQFNLNVFLNEQCKGALNIQDFINSINLSIEDLKMTGKKGYIEGVSNIFIKELNKMDITERPIHCTDIKRETVYIKDEDKWEKDDNDKTKMRKSLRDIEKKNLQMLPQLQETHDDAFTEDEFITLSVNTIGEYDTEAQKKQDEKILKNVLKEVTINK